MGRHPLELMTISYTTLWPWRLVGSAARRGGRARAAKPSPAQRGEIAYEGRYCALAAFRKGK